MAIRGDRTAGAFRTDRIAAGLSEGDEMTVPSLPVTYRKNLSKRHFGLDRFGGFDEPQPIADTRNMNIDANRRQIKADGNSQVRSFASDPGQFAEKLDECVRFDLAADFLHRHRKHGGFEPLERGG